MSNARARLADWARAAIRNPLFRYGLVIALAIAFLDQASKYWVVHILELPERLGPCAKNPGLTCAQIPLSPVFDLTFVRNYGMSFGLLAGGLASRLFLSMVTIGIVAALIVWLGRLDRRIAATAVGFIAGGALGNLYDRISYGYVVDFLDFSGLYFPWVFNVADAAINVGVAFLLLDAWLTRDAPAPQNQD
ncbi:MAG: signal peptidase II [Pseudomonadota bacterium]